MASKTILYAYRLPSTDINKIKTLCKVIAGNKYKCGYTIIIEGMKINIMRHNMINNEYLDLLS